MSYGFIPVVSLVGSANDKQLWNDPTLEKIIAEIKTIKDAIVYKLKLPHAKSETTYAQIMRIFVPLLGDMSCDGHFFIADVDYFYVNAASTGKGTK